MPRAWALGLALMIGCAGMVWGQVEQREEIAQVEHRAVWAHFSDIKDPETLQKSVDRMAGAGMNAIYILVWHNGGQAAYRSELCPMVSGAAEGFDPLGALIEAAKPKGIDVHAWFVNGSYGYARGGLFDTHPDWQLQSGGSSGDRWYDLGKPEVRQFQRDVMLECLRNYDVAGIHFDYIRFSGKGMCHCEHCQGQVQERWGIPPVTVESATFPLACQMSGNPLGRPSTAQVLASFEDSVPAVTMNALGQGKAALLNWQADMTGNLAVPELARRILESFGTDEGAAVYQIRSAATIARYGRSSLERGMNWLRGMGYKPVGIEEPDLAKVPAGATVIFSSQYLIAPEIAQWLEEFVTAGGNALFVDGPVFAIKEPALQRVLGLTGTARYFSAMKAVIPAAGQELIPAGPAVDLELEQKRAGAWEEFRRDVVTDLVRQVYQGAKQIKPEAQVSAAVFYNKSAADSVCQDWYGWLNEGIIGYVLPMAYTEENGKLQEALEEWKAADPDLARIIPGLSIYSRDAEGKAIPRDLDLVRQQEELCRLYKARGNCYFSLVYLNEALREQFAEGPYAQAAKAYYPAGR